MTEHAAVIAGGGPTGLMLAAELALAGVDVAIVERRASQSSSARAQAVCTSSARGIALTTRSPRRPPTQQRSAQAAGYLHQIAKLKQVINFRRVVVSMR